MKRVHYTDSYLMNPQHPVTVNIIGAGGTGSQVLTCMARLDVTLRALGHPGLFVTLYDPDIVTEANIGRQLFGPSDMGLNKAQCLITRINNFFGNDWKAEARLYPSVLKEVKRDEIANITITCTDNIKSRLDLWNVLGKVPSSFYTDNNTPLYWMDFGNTQTSGQVVLGTVPKKIRQPASTLYETVGSLKVITRFVKYARVKEEDSGPSCSLAEALEKQDLFINSTLAQLGCNILWKMFRNGMIEHNGLYIKCELTEMNVNYRIQLKFMLFPFLPESPPKKKIKIPSYFLTEIIYACALLYSKGVHPTPFLKKRLKCWEYWNPSSYATWLTVNSVSAIHSLETLIILFCIYS